jgi:hypothetical protein
MPESMELVKLQRCFLGSKNHEPGNKRYVKTALFIIRTFHHKTQTKYQANKIIKTIQETKPKNESLKRKEERNVKGRQPVQEMGAGDLFLRQIQKHKKTKESA